MWVKLLCDLLVASMLSSKYQLTSKGPYLLDEEKLYLIRDSLNNQTTPGNSGINSGKIDVLESSTGFYEDTIHPLQDLLHEKITDLDGLFKCGSKLFLTFQSGAMSFYDLEKSSTINSSLSRTKNQKFQSICSSRTRDSLFFTAYQNSNALHAYYVTSTSVTVAPPIRLDILDKNREYITGLACHPSKPLIFITFARGNVQVWNYTNLRKSLVVKSGDDEGGEQSLEEDIQEDPDEKEQTNSTKSSTLTLSPVGVLLPVPEKEKVNVAASISFDPSGRLVAITWTSTSSETDCVGVYDVRYLPTNSEFKQSPLGSFVLGSEQGRSLGSVCFHPAEPLLFVVCMKDKQSSTISSTGSTMLALSLLEPGVRVISSHTLDYTPSAISFPPGSTLFTSASISDGSFLLRSYTLSYEIIKCCRWMTPVVSKLSVPAEAYVEGDGVMYTKPTPGSSGGGWPLVLMIHNEMDIFTPGTRSGEVRYLRPMNTFYNLFRIKLNMSSQEKNGVAHICAIPSVARNPESDSISWITIPEENTLASPGLFCPLEIKCNELQTGGIAENGEWMAILTGSSFYAQKLATGKPSYLSSAPVVCFIKYTPSAQNNPEIGTVFGQFKDAIFYSPKTESSLTPLSTPQRTVEILALSEDGTTLKFLSRVGAVSSTFIGPTYLPISVSRMWYSGPTGINAILYASNPQNPEETQTLYLTSSGMLNFDVVSSTKFEFLEQERVLEVAWQPSSLTTPPQSSLLQARHLLWSESEQMIGVLTSHRVLLLTSDLTLINCYNFNNIRNHHHHLSPPDRALSISWVGRSLIFALESGAIDYLVPISSVTSRSPSSIQGLAAAMGEFPGPISRGRLCTLPNRQSLMGNVRMIACLPDRLLYASTTDITGQVFMSIMARPCLPVEPLILGIIQPPIPKQVSRKDLGFVDPFSSANLESKAIPPEVLESYKRSIIESLLTMYVPAKPVAGSNSSGGALPMTQSTRKLCLALCDAGYTQLVLVAAGVCVNPQEGSGADFPRNRWISPGMKFHLALRAGKFAEACNDLISSRPDLQELFIYPESYGGGTLPHRDSAHAKQFSAAACILAFIGQFDMARKLADLAGDELLLCHLLRTCQKPQNRDADILALQHALKGRSSAYDKIFQLLSKEGDTKPNYEIPVAGIGGSDRRTTMLSISSPLSDSPFPTKDLIDLKAIDKAQRQHVMNRGGGLGPPTKLGVLAMDSIEDWIGKSRLEVIAADRTHFSSGVGGNTANGPAEDNSYLPTGLDKPDTWVDDIGTGKEWDKVVGYWRFSDVIRPGEDDFISSGVPISRINILDLSKFVTPLEVFCDRNDRIQLLPTTSAVDPGEDHTKVKGLYDVVMGIEPYNGNQNLPLAGLRVPIGRGGPLDVGLFHQDPNRCHFTLEMSIFRCENATHLSAPPNGHCLAKRCCGLSGSQENQFMNPIWMFSVAADGALCFQFGSDEKNSLKTPPNEVNMGPIGDISVSVWTHVAVVVDTSQAIGGSTATVSLLVNGNRSAKGTLHYSTVAETDLAVSTLYFGSNLSGWRLTEIRVWADNRPVIEIEGQRDNYLPLASKRKRMQFRIKGSKKLFGPPPSSLEIGPEPDPNSIPVFNIHNRKTLEDDEKETGPEKTAPSQPKSTGGLLPPSSKGGLAPPGQTAAKGALSPPAGALAPPSKSPSPALNPPGKAGLTPPPAKSTLPAPGGLAPPGASKGGLAAPPLTTARSRRASLAGVPDRPTEVASPQEPPSPASSEAHVESKPNPTPEPDLVAAPSSPLKSPPSSLLQPPSTKILKSRRSSVGSFDPAVVSKSLSIARADSVEGVVEAKPSQQGYPISVAEVSVTDALRDIRRRPLSGGLPLLITHTAQSIDDHDKIIVIDMPSSSLPFTTHTLSAETAIISPSISSSNERLIAFYKQKKLTLVSCSISDSSAHRILGEMPMTFPLIFWSFDGRDRILLMTSTSLFSWDIRPSVIKSSRPQKIIDRIDISDPKRYPPS